MKFINALSKLRPGEKWKQGRGKVVQSVAPSFPYGGQKDDVEKQGQRKQLGGSGQALQAKRHMSDDDSNRQSSISLTPKDCLHLVP